MKIDINKKYRTKSDQWPVTIVSTDGPYPGFPVVGYAHHTGTPLLCHWSEDGKYPANTNVDLIEVREPREWKAVVVTGDPVLADGSLANYAEGDEEDPKYEIIRVREIID